MPAILSQDAQRGASRAGVPIVLDRFEVPSALDPALSATGHRNVQEAITNISKYAKARTVWLELGPHEGQAQVVVRDDGVGFDAGTQRTSAAAISALKPASSHHHDRQPAAARALR